jgi:hypothetical protein
MGKVTLYLAKATQQRMKEAAKAAGLSQSRWVRGLIREKTTTEWPDSVVKLVGTWTDLPSLEEIRKGLPVDLPREPI